MNTRDIWECLCKFLPINEIGRLRILSKMHCQIGTRILNKMIIISPKNIADIVTIIYSSASVESVVIYGEKLTEDEIEDVELDEGESADIEEYILSIDPDIRELDVLEETDAYDLLLGKKSLYLPYKMKISNKMGINRDVRGTINPNVEFANYYSDSKWLPGEYNVHNFAQGLFRLKSHKFENWYEWITGLMPWKPCECRHCDHETSNSMLVNGKIRAQLIGDHGS